MEKIITLLDWENQYHQNVHIAKNNMYIQCDPNPNPNIFLLKKLMHWNDSLIL